jgi:transposase InsO family protein
MEDRRCKLGLQGRLELVWLIENGSTLRAAAHRWWHRWAAASPAERASRACLRTRSTRPRSCPWGLSAEAERAILEAREKTNWGPMQLQFLCGRHRSTIWKVLKRHGVSRQRRSERPQTTRRYEWTEAGALLHIDAFEAPKFDRPGHWAHGDRSERHRTRRAGKVKVIGVIDDHTRLVYCEIHSAENARTVSATLRRAAAWFLEQGCSPVQAVMSDNAKCYATSLEFRDTLTELGARHILIPPRTPRWNGKIERFFGTLTANGPTAASGPTAPSATAPWHPSSASITAADHTQPAAADRPSPAFTISAGRTASAGERCRRSAR